MLGFVFCSELNRICFTKTNVPSRQTNNCVHQPVAKQLAAIRQINSTISLGEFHNQKRAIYCSTSWTVTKLFRFASALTKCKQPENVKNNSRVEWANKMKIGFAIVRHGSEINNNKKNSHSKQMLSERIWINLIETRVCVSFLFADKFPMTERYVSNETVHWKFPRQTLLDMNTFEACFYDPIHSSPYFTRINPTKTLPFRSIKVFQLSPTIWGICNK